MRVLKEILHPSFKITLYHWNNRYLIKLEHGYFEQTFKIDQFDIDQEETLYEILDEKFLQDALGRFQDMEKSFGEAIQRA